MNISVVGCGRWGTFIGYYLDSLKNNQVTMIGRQSSLNFKELKEQRKNKYLNLSNTTAISSDYGIIETSELVVISINSQGLRSFLTEHKTLFHGQPIILCMKGLEIGTGKRLTEVVQQVLGKYPTAVWLGPGHPQEFVNGIPNAMVIDANNIELKTKLVDAFSSPLIRFYYGVDLIGNELGGALKNVIGIAAGILDGLELSALKGALIARAPVEVSRLIQAMGGNPTSAYGLCHLGDYAATVFSEHSHNRMFGEAIVKNQTYTDLAEGYYTAKAVHELAQQKKVDMPICEVVYDVLYNNKDPKEAINTLFLRSTKKEFV